MLVLRPLLEEKKCKQLCANTACVANRQIDEQLIELNERKQNHKTTRHDIKSDDGCIALRHHIITKCH